VAVLTVSALAVPWSARPAAAIAHGTDAPDGDYRFSVLLTMTGLPAEDGGTRDSSCSGALIAPRWVITAGHCFRDAGGRRVNRTVAERTTALVGRTDLRQRDGREVDVVDAYQADGADVALAELGEPVTGITPVRVATEPPVRGEVLRLTGFGLITDSGRTASRLQTGQFTVDAIDGAVLETSGRAPHPDTSPCLHDSGGPYFHEEPGGTFVLAAVVSSGPGCPHTGPDLSARVDNLSDWINDTVASPGPEIALRASIGVGVAALLVVGIVLTRRARARR
jgi:secreted trypsin-like serine protease